MIVAGILPAITEVMVLRLYGLTLFPSILKAFLYSLCINAAISVPACFVASFSKSQGQYYRAVFILLSVLNLSLTGLFAGLFTIPSQGYHKKNCTEQCDDTKLLGEVYRSAVNVSTHDIDIFIPLSTVNNTIIYPLNLRKVKIENEALAGKPVQSDGFCSGAKTIQYALASEGYPRVAIGYSDGCEPVWQFKTAINQSTVFTPGKSISIEGTLAQYSLRKLTEFPFRRGQRNNSFPLQFVSIPYQFATTGVSLKISRLAEPTNQKASIMDNTLFFLFNKKRFEAIPLHKGIDTPLLNWINPSLLQQETVQLWPYPEQLHYKKLPESWYENSTVMAFSYQLEKEFFVSQTATISKVLEKENYPFQVLTLQ